MRTETVLMRLDDYHVRITVLLARAAKLLAESEANTGAIAHVRWELMRTLREYQLFKHTEIFDPLSSSATADRRNRAALLKTRCLAMADTFIRHVERWTLAGVSKAGIDYLTDAWAMTQQLSIFLAEERMNIQQLLNGLERIRTS